ncbi:DUF3052 family protein [Aeromicrobium sp. SMF47]|uniref:DUF3052 family protein n=1 Tax=Aeromicrobium yanjiei TaxID=2662028 RepID=A0A5Q2MP41_9ACTN|nr:MULTISPECIES: DUF3052 family protein [Aeromicrobium]MRJ76541.1 DUF3052 family protein [Aeromicrobium yanjiei]MRK00891.1 DUF3052 family protein [Aeromicrobium sp. S22]QGG42295.1 DUF3052 family protein [Aeromicrobium yanjiei]
MTDLSNAAKLRISDGFVVWVVGTSVEETTLLDPMPEGAEMVEVRDEEDPESVDAAILVADDRLVLADRFDEILPQIGSIPLVWVCYPQHDSADIDEESIQELAADYGWYAEESVVLDDTWAALRIDQS